MPMIFQYANNGIGIIAQGSGHLIVQDILDLHRDAYSPEGVIKKLQFILIDFMQVESSEINADTIRLLAEKDKKIASLNSEIIFAVVVSKDFVFGLSRMWEVYVEESQFETNVFRDLNSAEQWIYERIKIKYKIETDNLFQ